MTDAHITNTHTAGIQQTRKQSNSEKKEIKAAKSQFSKIVYVSSSETCFFLKEPSDNL